MATVGALLEKHLVELWPDELKAESFEKQTTENRLRATRSETFTPAVKPVCRSLFRRSKSSKP